MPETSQQDAPTDASPADMPNLTTTIVESTNKQSEAVTALATSNQSLMAKVDELSATVASLQSLVPPEGAAILSVEEAKLWRKYNGLGAPDALKTSLTEYEQAKQSVMMLNREISLRDAAEILNYKVVVLRQIIPAEVALEVRVDDGERKAYAIVNGESVPMSDYVQKNLADFIPALVRAAPMPIIPQLNEGSGTAINIISSLVDNRVKALATRGLNGVSNGG